MPPHHFPSIYLRMSSLPFGKAQNAIALFSSYVSSFNAMSLFVLCDLMHIVYKMSDVGTIHLLFVAMRLWQRNLHDLMQAKLEANEDEQLLFNLFLCIQLVGRVKHGGS